MKDRIKRYLQNHSIMTNPEDAVLNELFQEGERTGDYNKFDRYYEGYLQKEREKNPVSWWCFKPRTFTTWKPVSVGSDEYNRKNYVIGNPLIGHLVIASRRSAHMYYDRSTNTTTIYPRTRYWDGSLQDIDVGHGITLTISERNGDVFAIEIDHNWEQSS